MKKFLLACLAGTIGIGCITGAYITINNSQNQDTQNKKETDSIDKMQKLINEDNGREYGVPSSTYTYESQDILDMEESGAIDKMQNLLDNDTDKEDGVPSSTYTYKTQED